jgi:hypothetical protein
MAGLRWRTLRICGRALRQGPQGLGAPPTLPLAAGAGWCRYAGTRMRSQLARRSGARDAGLPGWVAPSGVGSQAGPPVGDKLADQVGAHREISLSGVLVLTGTGRDRAASPHAQPGKPCPVMIRT